MSKIVFLDVDGTLIDYETKLPDSARKAVDQARANGHKVYICTGCSKDEILQRNLCELDGMILGNGTYVEDHNHVIMHQAMPLEEVKKVVHWCQERKLAFYLETNSGVYCNEQMIKDGPAVMIKYGQGKGANLENAIEKAKSFIDSFTLIHGDEFYREDVNKIDFIIRDYQDHLDAITAFPHLAHNTWGGKGELALFSDLGPTGINKKHAIEVLLDYLKLGKEDTISFGDAKVDCTWFPAVLDLVIVDIKSIILVFPLRDQLAGVVGRTIVHDHPLKILTGLFTKGLIQSWQNISAIICRCKNCKIRHITVSFSVLAKHHRFASSLSPDYRDYGGRKKEYPI